MTCIYQQRVVLLFSMTTNTGQREYIQVIVQSKMQKKYMVFSKGSCCADKLLSFTDLISQKGNTFDEDDAENDTVVFTNMDYGVIKRFHIDQQ